MSEAFVRYQSPTPNARGHFTGVFGLANGLAWAGVLSEDEMEFWRTTNAWYESALTHPAPGVYDRGINPFATSWFRTATATRFLAPVSGYLAILHAHGVACVEVRSDDPGRVVHQDEYQIVVVPYADGSNVAVPSGGIA